MSEQPKTTITVGLASKVPVERYGSTEPSIFISADFPPFTDMYTLEVWRKNNEQLVRDTLDKFEWIDRMRRGLEIPARLKKYSAELDEKECLEQQPQKPSVEAQPPVTIPPAPAIAPAPAPYAAGKQIKPSSQGPKDLCPQCKINDKPIKFRVCYDCKLDNDKKEGR